MDKNQFDRALSYSDAAVGLLKKSNIPPTPRFYELLYTYATGTNPDLNERINAVFEGGNTPDTNMATALHDEFLQPRDVEEKLNTVSAEIANRIDAVHGAIDNAFANANNYSGLLQSATGDLEMGMDEKAIAALSANLLDETRRMQSANTQLESRLELARDDIFALQRELEEVRRESMLDPLTNIQNRKSFDRAIKTTVDDAEKNGDSLSLLILDIDHFKQFNDNFGHQTGDQVLRLVAMTLSANITKTGTAARYGGEEFAAILPGTSLEEAIVIAQQLCKSIQSKELLKRSTNEKLGRVTASIGVATFRSGDTTTTLIERADLCLYAAKRDGRNRVIDEDRELAGKSQGNNFAA